MDAPKLYFGRPATIAVHTSDSYSWNPITSIALFDGQKAASPRSILITNSLIH